MTKERKTSSNSRVTSASASSFKGKKKKKNEVKESEVTNAPEDTMVEKNLENVDQKSIAESDTGKNSGDALATGDTQLFYNNFTLDFLNLYNSF